jgi:hypothetical protein
MTEASKFWYDRVEKAIRDLNQVLEDHRRALVDQVALRAELRVALFKAGIANRPGTAATFDDARPSKQPLRAAAAAALVLGSPMRRLTITSMLAATGIGAVRRIAETTRARSSTRTV